MAGGLALVGSGEYLPQMHELELELLRFGQTLGKSATYVQLATAAGKESVDRLKYWQELGETAARRIGVEAIFLPVFDKHAANQLEHLSAIENAGLIYLSGGDPHYLAQVLVGSLVGDAIVDAWQNGSSLAGCSAGAMALGAQVPEVFSLRKSSVQGLGVSEAFQVLPHYDRYFGWASDRVMQFVSQFGGGSAVLGIDEDTALYQAGTDWKVFGKGKVHCLSERPIRVLSAGDSY